MTRPHRLGLLAALYFSQGLPYGFFTLALPIVLRQRGTDLATIGASSVLLLPWALKFVWGPVVDRYGTRRSWIMPLQLGTVATLGALSLVDAAADLRALVIGMAVVSLLASTQDVATDALAVSLLPPEDRGIGNGLQVGAYRLGMVVGGSAVLVVYSRIGPPVAFALMAVLLALATVPLLWFREGARVERPRFDPTQLVRGLWALGPAWLFALSLYKAGDAAASGMLKALLVDAGWTTEGLGFLFGLGGSTAGLVGALLGGWLTDRLGRPRAVIGFGVLQACVIASYTLLAASDAGVRGTVAVVATEHVLSSMATVSLFAAMMDRVRPGHEATDYTLQACVAVFASGMFGSLAGGFAEQVGYTLHFAACGLLSAVGVAVMAAVLRASSVPVPAPVPER